MWKLVDLQTGKSAVLGNRLAVDGTRECTIEYFADNLLPSYCQLVPEISDELTDQIMPNWSAGDSRLFELHAPSGEIFVVELRNFDLPKSLQYLGVPVVFFRQYRTGIGTRGRQISKSFCNIIPKRRSGPDDRTIQEPSVDEAVKEMVDRFGFKEDMVKLLQPMLEHLASTRSDCESLKEAFSQLARRK